MPHSKRALSEKDSGVRSIRHGDYEPTSFDQGLTPISVRLQRDLDMMNKLMQIKYPVFIFFVLAYVTLFVSFSQTYAATIIVPDHYTTIQAAINAASANDTIVVRSGTYRENLRINKPITLTAQTYDAVNPVRNTTIIDAGGFTISRVIEVPAGTPGIVTIRGFIITNADDGLRLFSGFLAEYNYFHTGNDFIDAAAGANGILRGNVFFDANDDAVDIDDSNRNITIEGNRIYSSSDDGIEIRLQPQTAPSTPIDITIRNNQIIGNGRAGLQLIDYASDPQNTNRRFIITGNLFANNGQTGIGFMPDERTQEDLSGANIIESVVTYNNTFYNNRYGISGGDNHVVFNNIIANNTGTGAWRVAGLAGDDSVVAYNLFFQNLTHIAESTTGLGNRLNQDPQFVSLPSAGADGMWNTVDDDYSGLVLKSTSPAIDAGVAQYRTTRGALIPSSPLTFNGVAPDLGWKEASGGSVPVATATPTTIATTAPTTVPTAIPTTTAKLPATYYIDCLSGNDSNSGLSASLAWRTINRTRNMVFVPGDVVLLKRGCIWTGQTLEIAGNGSSNQRIIVSTYGTGALPQIINSVSGSDGVLIEGSYITVENIHAKANAPIVEIGCQNNPVGHIVGFTFATNSHDNILQNAIAEGFYAGASIDQGSFNNRIRNSQFLNNKMMYPLDIIANNDAGAFGILVRGNNNEIAYNQITGSIACSYDYQKDGAAVEIYGAADNHIHHNWSTDTNTFTELGEPTSANNLYTYNVFYSSLSESKFLVTRGAGNTRGPVNNTMLYNNTVYLTGALSQGFVCHAGCNASILTMRNNIFNVTNRVGYSDGAFNEDYNLFWGGSPSGFTPNTHSRTANPQFVSPQTGDFRLQSVSPAIDRGIILGFSSDFAGNAVPFNAAPDMGAYEFSSIIQPTPVPSATPIVATATLAPTSAATSVPPTTTTLTFTSVADAQVFESSATSNYGRGTSMRVEGGSDPDYQSYIRFDVTGIPAQVTSAKLRVYATSDTYNGPAVHLSNNNWAETTLNWSNRPAALTATLHDLTTAISPSQWFELDVTAAVTGNGTYTFVLITSTTDGLTMASRETSFAPQLVVVFGSQTASVATSTPTVVATSTANPTSTVTSTTTPTATRTPTVIGTVQPTVTFTATPTMTRTQNPTATNTVTPTATFTATATLAPTSAATTIPPVATSLTFNSAADAQVFESSVTSNYGRGTSMRVEGGSDPDYQSYIRFDVTGITAPITSAKLRVYATSDTYNGPAVHLSNNNWVETTLNWNNRPAALTATLHDLTTAISPNQWFELDVTAAVTGNGAYTFVLSTSTTDGLTMATRETNFAPQLVVAFGSQTASVTTSLSMVAAATQTPIPTATNTLVEQLHVGDVSVTIANQSSTWQAQLTVTVHTANEIPVVGVTVTGNWNGDTAIQFCITDLNGSCTLTSPAFLQNDQAATFNIQMLSRANAEYDSVRNHDPESSLSNGIVSIQNN
jgi:hypothetical protein